jgi:hypothetical protein
MIRPCNLIARSLVTITFTLFLSLAVSAQFRAAVQGVVSDNSGGVVPNASVTLTNKETNQTQVTKTSDEGFYRFSNLAPGLYSVTVENQNFKKTVIDDVKVDAEATKGVDVTLPAGVISETVTVTSEAVPLETEDANIRKTITTTEILNLPQRGRDPYSLARTAPGVFGDAASGSNGGRILLPNNGTAGAGDGNTIFSTENQPQISANGQRVTSNNYQVDGTSVNSQTWGGAAVITPSQESVKEVSVTASTYSAEDGRNSGAQVKVVTQNGTNQWHGSAFFKLNDPSLNAFNKFPRFIGSRETEGPKRVEQEYKTYGGSFGGRIIRDRLFFFFSYEGFRTSNNGTYFSYIDTPEFRQSVISARPNTVTAALLQSPGVEPRVVRIIPTTCATFESIGLHPDTRNNCQTVANGLDIGSVGGTYGTYLDPWQRGGGFNGIADLQFAELASETSGRGHQYFTRVDWNVTGRDKFAFSSFVVPTTGFSTDPDAQSRPMSDLTTDRLNMAFGAIYTRTLSTTMINEARFNFTKWGFDEFESNPNANFGLPRVEIENVMSGPRLRYGARRVQVAFDERQLDFRDILTKIVGNHVLKFGGEYRRDLNGNNEKGFARPLYSFLQPWNFANGTPILEEVAVDVNGKPTGANTKFFTSELAFFAQDDWKFRPNLTLNLGLRWSYFSPITASDGVIGNLLPDANGGLAGARIVTDETLYDKDFNNFGPQLGFAWSPTKFRDKLVIRGGAGMGYDRLPNALLSQARRNPPNGRNNGFCCAGPWDPFLGGRMSYVASSDGTVFGYPANPNLAGTDAASGLPLGGNVEIYGAPRDLKTSYVMRYSLEGQYELPARLVATVGYSGSQGRHFVRILPLMVMAPTSNNLIGNAFFASSDVNSSYNALLLRLQGRFAKQFSFDANYRFSKSEDTASFEGSCFCTNQSYPIDQSQERGPSDFDVRHYFVMTGIWEIPTLLNNSWGKQVFGGWQLSGILTRHTGFPWTPKLDTNLIGPSGRGFGPIRPTSYNGTEPLGNSNDNFLQPGGLFAGSNPTTVFGTTVVGNTFAGNPPAIGRNTFRGPRYFSVDMTIAKKFRFGNLGFFGESAELDVRFNFFNIFNTLNLVPIGANTASTFVTNINFATATAGQAGRVGEFQMRFSF